MAVYQQEVSRIQRDAEEVQRLDATNPLLPCKGEH